MSANKERTVSRDVIATQIPSGDKQTLTEGTTLFIHQTLGGSYTVQTDFGLFRIDGKDGDAIGEETADHSVETKALADGSPDPETVWAQLRKVFDPEIPVNIVDLGLVYSMDIEKKEDEAYKVSVAMTLTALLVPGVDEADVNITWEPPWNQSMISEEGKMKLGLI
jgi:metal-sulfur cluster biosynthetic enzyme